MNSSGIRRGRRISSRMGVATVAVLCGSVESRLKMLIQPCLPPSARFTLTPPVRIASVLSSSDWHMMLARPRIPGFSNLLLMPSFFVMSCERWDDTPPKHTDLPIWKTGATMGLPSAYLRPSDATTTTLPFRLWSSSMRERNFSSSNAVSGRRIMSAPKISPVAASAENAATQPASLPSASMAATWMGSPLTSIATSLTEEARYRAAEGNPGLWSVTESSLPIVLGVPQTVMPCFTHSPESLRAASMVPFPPVMMRQPQSRSLNLCARFS